MSALSRSVRVLKEPGAPADDSRVVQSDPQSALVELKNAYKQYRDAMATWRSAAKAGSAAAEDAAEQLLHGRVALYRALVATGWAPPTGVGAQLERDVALVEAPDDFEALLAS